MPNWKSILDELKATGSPHDVVRRRYLKRLFKKTGRNVIAYYSGWLQKGSLARQGIPFELNDADKNGFMVAIHSLDRSKGLDLILHTPGGSLSALESLVDYLRQMFGKNIRAIVPQIAMSAGTMLALACQEVVMGKHSNLGPIDPQVGGLAAHAIIEEFLQAKSDVATNPHLASVWVPILQKYGPTLVGECVKAIAWSNQVVKEWLVSGMFSGESDATIKADRIVAELGDHAMTLSHGRHISAKKAADLGIKVSMIEADSIFQDIVLSIHHSFIQTLSETPAFRIIENHKGVAFIQATQQVLGVTS